MLRRLASWYLRRTEPKAKVEPWDEPLPVPFVRVRLGAGKSCQVLQEFTIPGEWVIERVGTHEWRHPVQQPPKKVWLCTGIGVVK